MHVVPWQALSRHAWPVGASDAPVLSVSGSVGDLSYEWLQDLCDSLTSNCRRRPDASTGKENAFIALVINPLRRDKPI
jgi:hypothetical protein